MTRRERILALKVSAWIVLIVALTGGGIWMALDQSSDAGSAVNENRSSITANRAAILTSCNTLRDLFLRLGGEDSRQSNAPPSKAQQLAELRLSVIVRVMTPAERRKHRELMSYLASHGGLVTAPDCERIAAPAP